MAGLGISEQTLLFMSSGIEDRVCKFPHICSGYLILRELSTTCTGGDRQAFFDYEGPLTLFNTVTRASTPTTSSLATYNSIKPTHNTACIEDFSSEQPRPQHPRPAKFGTLPHSPPKTAIIAYHQPTRTTLDRTYNSSIQVGSFNISIAEESTVPGRDKDFQLRGCEYLGSQNILWPSR